MRKFTVLSDELNEKRLQKKGEPFNIKAIIVFTEEFDKKDFEEFKSYTYEMIYDSEYPILIKKGAPLKLRKKIIAAAVSEEIDIVSVDEILAKHIKVVGE